MIPFNKPYVPDKSKSYVLDALQLINQQGDGHYSEIATKLVMNLVGEAKVLLTPSCTDALEMASVLSGIGPGDEVILPSFTFTSAAIAITKFGATPVFVDVEPSSKCIDVNQVAESITHKTKAISWVNYAGVVPDLQGLKFLAEANNLILIEDNAHSLGGTHKGQFLGTFGDFATQSFHATKNIQCGEGGALVINNGKFNDRAEIIREKGTDRTKFTKGQIDKYQWVDHGGSHLLADTLAAVLVGQLEEFPQIQSKRYAIFDTYVERLRTWSILNNFEIQFTYLNDNHTAHMFYLIAPSWEVRDNLIKKAKDRGITISPHYQSLHNSKAGIVFGRHNFKLTTSEMLSDRLVRLPIYFEMSELELDLIVDSILN